MYFNNENNTTKLDIDYSEKKKFNFKYLIIIIVVLIAILGLVLFIPRMTDKKYNLVLNGDTDIIIKQYDIYEELGFYATDNKGNDISEQVKITGNVDTAVAGEYTITYTLDDIVLERTVLVIANESQTTYLILSGSSTMFLKVGDKYIEPGYMVIDSLEYDLTDKVNVSGNVNTTVAGTYKLTYSVTNQSGQTIIEERTVIVMDSSINVSYSPTTPTNGTVTINVTANDNYFNYLLLPDNSKVTTRSVSYKVNKNGTYNFTIYSKDGSSKMQEVKINNIDTEAPSGSCQVNRKAGVYTISVSAKDNKKINNYQYYFNNSLIKTDTKNVITYQGGNTDNIYVIVSDQAGNTKKISCNVKMSYDLEMHFINVGRGDAILIRTADKTIMIDGGYYTTSNTVLSYLKGLGVKRFDAVIGSHMHNDHIQAQGPIIDNYPVDRVYYPQDIHTCNPVYCNSLAQRYVLDAINRHKIPQTILKPGDHLEFGDIIIDVIAPLHTKTTGQMQHAENYNSSNFILTYGKTRMMFTGDHVQSSNLLKEYGASYMNIDLLKYPHHGEAALGQEMAYAMSPQYVISPNDNIDSLSQREEWQYFADMNSKVYYNGRDKHILVKSDGNKLSVFTNVNASDYKR